MKNYLIIGGLAIIVIAGIAFFLLRPSHLPAPSGGSPGLPTASSTGQTGVGLGLEGTTTGSGTAPAMLTLPTTGTTTVVVQDFLHNGTTIEDTQNPGQYYLAGSIGYCLPDGSCPGGAPSSEYHIVYNAVDQDFIIALISEPLGQARTDAENYLQSVLGAPQTTLCQLKYYVGTDSHTNDLYAGKNLGFSFCPGATKLPN